MKMEIDTQATVYYKYNFTKKKLLANSETILEQLMSKKSNDFKSSSEFKNDIINFFTIIKMSDTINLHDVKV